MSQAIVPPSATPFSAPALTAGGINELGSLRLAGTINGGPPTTGTFQTNDAVFDTKNTTIWVCTSGGTPGTWVQITAVSANNLNVGGTNYPGSQSAQPNTVVVRDANGIDNSVAFAPTGLTGATTASRYVGATANGAPTSGSFQVGDFVIDQTGTVWICTAAGSPGTWVQIHAANAASLGGIAALNYLRTDSGAPPQTVASQVTFTKPPTISSNGTTASFISRRYTLMNS